MKPKNQMAASLNTISRKGSVSGQRELVRSVSTPMSTCAIALLPFTQKICDTLHGQEKKYAITTDNRLRVVGAPDNTVYALGDCATIDSLNLLGKIQNIWER